MWLLKDKDGKLKYLKTNQTFTVGRKEGSLVLPDNSVSRRHAEITVVPRKDIGKIEDNMEPLSNCIIKDPGSKYGNFIIADGNVEIQIPKDGYTLKHMDRIRFGVQDSIYIVMYVPIITATSGLNATEKDSLRHIIDTIDGKITPGWEPICTHMTVSNPKMSEKLTCALAYGTSIVPMEYWKSVVQAFETNEEMPNPFNFVGIIHEKIGMLGKISVLPNPLRRTLFKDLIFVHFDSHQYKVYERMIHFAGGKSLLYKNETHRNLDVCNDNVIVVQLVESNTTQATGTGDAKYAAACEKLGRVRRRTIPTGEIALAICHVSTKTCCNPKHDYAKMFKARKSDNTPENSSILAHDTQDVDLPPTTSGRDGFESRITDRKARNSDKSIFKNDYIKESSEESIKIVSQPAAIVHPKPSNYIPESVSSDGVNLSGKYTEKKPSLLMSDSKSTPDDSVKVASLNYDKHLEQNFNVKTLTNENSMKRNRKEDEQIETAKKKICLAVSIDDGRNENQSVDNKKDSSFFEKKDVDKDLFKINQGKPLSKVSHKVEANESLRKHLVADQDAQNQIASKSSSYSDSEGKNETPRILQSTDRTSLKNQTKEERSRKRKISESKDTWEVKDTSKRNKVTTNGANKSSKVDLKTECTEKTMTDFAISKKMIDVEAEWTRPKKSLQSSEDSKEWFATKKDMSIDRRDNKPSVYRRSNTTELLKKDALQQPLLRIKSANEVSTSSPPKFGKRFRKAFKLTHGRINMDDMINMYSWDKENSSKRTNNAG